MKVLIVCSGNFPDFSFEKHQSFIYDQINAVTKFDQDISFDTFFVKGKGINGYLANLKLIRQHIKNNKPALIHAHGGHIGLLCNLQRKVPVITTFHGSDINFKKNRIMSAMAALLSRHVIYVSEKLKAKAIIKSKKCSVIPCGVDFDIFYPLSTKDDQPKFILFASAFDNAVKNYPLAKKAVELSHCGFEIGEIKNKSRTEVNLLLNQASLLLLTSFSEGSPQIIKEAMAVNCPIVATDVGDIREIIAGTEGCYIAFSNPDDLAEKINLAFDFSETKERTNGRNKIAYLDNKIIAGKIREVYCKVKGERLK